MSSSLPPSLDIVFDIKFGIIADGVRHILHNHFGITDMSVPGPQPAPKSRSARQRLLIADFACQMGQADMRLAELRAYLSSHLLLVIMPMPWDDIAIQLVRAGAHAVLYPDAGAADLREAIQAVVARRTYLPSILERSLAQRYLDGGPNTIDALTNREMELFRGLARGLSSSEMAAALNIGIKTVDTHRANLLRKLHVRNNVELAHLAFRHGIIPV